MMGLLTLMARHKKDIIAIVGVFLFAFVAASVVSGCGASGPSGGFPPQASIAAVTGVPITFVDKVTNQSLTVNALPDKLLVLTAPSLSAPQQAESQQS